MRLSHRLSQKLLITPQLKQALHLLQLPYPALFNYINREISENPLLQLANQEDLDAKIKQCLSTNSQTNFTKQISSNLSDKQKFTAENLKSNNPSLHEYLLHQLRMTFLSNEEISIAEDLINHIDSNGYLCLSLEKFVKGRDITIEQAQKVLVSVQSLEPSGVGARNLQECLLLQLTDKGREHALAYKIVESHFKELTKKIYADIAKKLKVNLEEVKNAVKEIASLNPKPGASFSQAKENLPVVVDFLIKNRGNKLEITSKDKELPQLKINSNYRKLLKNPNVSEEIKQFIKERLRRALWLISAVEQRKVNTAKVMRLLINAQEKALLKDFIYLKPLTLKKISQKTKLHVSTVGRIMKDKYIDTPKGILRAKDLLSPKIKSSGRNSIASKSLFSYLKQIISEENQPLSDKKIADLLKQKGISVSRRTITKYRNCLKILPSYLR